LITNDSKDILIADDSAFFRFRLQEILENGGHRAMSVADGALAIEELARKDGRIDLLVLDLHMPNVDGVGVLEWINRNGYGGGFPVVIVSTVTDEPGYDLEQLRALGVVGFISKGFSPQQIILHANMLLFPGKALKGVDREVRVPVQVPCEFRHSDASVHHGSILNISASGAYINTEVELSEGDTISVGFSLPGIDRDFSILAVVRWTTAGIELITEFSGSGVFFSAIVEDDGPNGWAPVRNRA
jgi:CheY-like chemotaxis protein